MNRFRLLLIILIASLALTLSACGTTGTLKPPDTSGQGSLIRRIGAALFTHASMADMQLKGTIGALNTDIAAHLVTTAAQVSGADPQRVQQLQAIIQFAVASGFIEQSGPRLVEMEIEGETTPRLLLCKVVIAGECSQLLPHAPVRIYAHPVGAANYVVWIVDRVVKL